MEVGLMEIVRSVNRSWIYDTQFSLYRAFHPGEKSGGKCPDTVYTYIHIHRRIIVYIQAYIYMYPQFHICIYVYIQIQIYMYIYIYKHSNNRIAIYLITWVDVQLYYYAQLQFGRLIDQSGLHGIRDLARPRCKDSGCDADTKGCSAAA